MVLCSCGVSKMGANNKVNRECKETNDKISRKIPFLIRKNGVYQTVQYLKKNNALASLKPIAKYRSIKIFTDKISPLKQTQLLLKNSNKISFDQQNNQVEEENITLSTTTLINPFINLVKELENVNKQADNYWLKLNKGHLLNGKTDRSPNNRESNQKDKTIDDMNKWNLDSTNFSFNSVNKVRHTMLEQKEIDAYYKSQKYEKITVNATLQSRLSIGLGEVNVRELDVQLDYLLGIPFIPASSIKGCFRHYYYEEFYERQYGKNEDLTKVIQTLFGSSKEEKGYRGQIIFTDSYPVITNKRPKILERDIIGVKNHKYYSEKNKMPSERERMNPIFFPTIKKGQQFEFQLYVRNTSKDKDDEMFKEQVESITKDFKNMLEEHGIGAKTRNGYGYFKV